MIQLIISRCTELESGGRMIDAILTNTMLPRISREFLTRTMNGEEVSKLHVTTAESRFVYQFD